MGASKGIDSARPTATGAKPCHGDSAAASSAAVLVARGS
jgi:hypothetical protein